MSRPPGGDKRRIQELFQWRDCARPEKWPTTAPVAYKSSVVGGWLIKQVVPEATRKVSAPKVFRPSNSDITDGLGKFLNQQKEFLSFVKQAEGIDYNKVRLRSPVTPLMRYSLADAFVVTVVHGWRHLAQARRVSECLASRRN